MWFLTCFVPLFLIGCVRSENSLHAESGESSSSSAPRYVFPGNLSVPQSAFLAWQGEQLSGDYYRSVLSILSDVQTRWPSLLDDFRFIIVGSMGQNRPHGDIPGNVTQWENTLKKSLSQDSSLASLLENSSDPDTLPWYQYIEPYSGGGWIQDEGEFVESLKANISSPSFFDMSQSGLADDLLRAVGGRDKLIATANLDGGATAGGAVEENLEDGVFVSSTLSTNVRKQIENMVQKEVQVLDTGWLRIGHVDEFVTYVPVQNPSSSNTCHGAMLVADPLIGLLLLSQTPHAAQPLLDSSRKPFEWRYNHAFSPFSENEVYESLTYFANVNLDPSTVASESVNDVRIEDFDLTKPVRGTSIYTDPNTGQRLISGTNVDLFVKANLFAKRIIDEQVHKLVSYSKCEEEVVYLPQFFFVTRPAYASEGNVAAIAEDKFCLQDEVCVPHEDDTAEPQEPAFPSPEGIRLYSRRNALNMVVLFDHVILPDSQQTNWNSLYRQRLGALLGSQSKVHFVNANQLDPSLGGLHCINQIQHSKDRLFSTSYPTN